LTSLGNPVGLPETLLGSLGCLAAPASAISVPGQNFGFRFALAVAGALAIAP